MAKKADVFPVTERAIIFATALHAGQFKYGNRIPYVAHITSVARLVSLCTRDDEVVAAAVLHDALEKGGITREAFQKQFGARITKLITGLTEPEKGTWDEKKQKILSFLKKGADDNQLLIACADKADNIYNLLLLKAAIGKQWESGAGTSLELLQWYHETALEIFMSKALFRKKAPSTLLFTYSSSFRELFGTTD